MCPRDAQNTALKCTHQCTTLQATFSQVSPSFPRRYRRMAQALAEVDGGNPTRPRPPCDPQLPYAKTPPAPAPASFAPQSQRWLDEDDHDHFGDDEQEYDPDDAECDYYERERSATPTPPPAQQQQHQHQPSHQMPPPPQLQQQQRQSQPPIQPQQAQPSSGPPSPFDAHVHFHSRVRITSGLRHSHGGGGGGGGGGTHALGDSSDSDSPSSSISAPLRFRSRDTMPRAPLTERVSRLATQALQRRRAVAGARPSSAVSRLLARDCEYAPLIAAGVPATYGAARYGVSVSNGRANGVRDQSHDGDDSAFGEWPWRALNRHVSDCSSLHRDSRFI